MSEPLERAVDAAIVAILDAGGTIDFRVHTVIRAALSAIRSPTQEMIDAGVEAIGIGGYPYNVANIFRAMIGEALK